MSPVSPGIELAPNAHRAGQLVRIWAIVSIIESISLSFLPWGEQIKGPGLSSVKGMTRQSTSRRPAGQAPASQVYERGVFLSRLRPLVLEELDFVARGNEFRGVVGRGGFDGFFY